MTNLNGTESSAGYTSTEQSALEPVDNQELQEKIDEDQDKLINDAIDDHANKKLGMFKIGEKFDQYLINKIKKD